MATSKQEPGSGLTWRSMLAILFSSILFLPVAIYLQLVGGAYMAMAAVFMTVILFSEISRIFRSDLSQQEFCIIFEMVALAASPPAMLGMVYRGYFVNSPTAMAFELDNVALPKLVPTWWAPPLGSVVYLQRTFFHIEWLVPMVLAHAMAFVFYYLAEIALTMLVSHLYVDVEKLPFPLGVLDASLITTLAERRTDRMKAFVLAIYPGMVWGALLYAVPIITGVQMIPVPYLDLTPFTEKFLPGALIGVMTDLMPVVLGLLIPITTSVYMFIGSISVWIIGNTLSLTAFQSFFPLWKAEYFYGMSISNSWQRSLLRVWIMPQIGFSLGLAGFLLATGYKSIIAAFKSLARISEAEKKSIGFPSLRVIIPLYLIGTIGSVLLFSALVPDLPIWIPLLISVGFSFINCLVTTRALGETAYPISIPYVWQTTLTLAGYSRLDAWIFPPVIGGIYTARGGSPSLIQKIKVAQLTNTRPMEIIKALVITAVVYQFFSIIYVDFFWKMAPIPSSVYPNAMIQWPIQIINESVWITGVSGASFPAVILSAGVMAVICVLGTAMTRFVGIPFSATALVSGIFNIPTFAIPVFVGSLLGRYVFPRVFKEAWKENSSIVAAGIWCGEGIIVGLAVSVALISKATWIWPW